MGIRGRVWTFVLFVPGFLCGWVLLLAALVVLVFLALAALRVVQAVAGVTGGVGVCVGAQVQTHVRTHAWTCIGDAQAPANMPRSSHPARKQTCVFTCKQGQTGDLQSSCVWSTVHHRAHIQNQPRRGLSTVDNQPRMMCNSRQCPHRRSSF